jgi:hypothetical protein
VDFLEFENLGGSDTILKCLRSGQKNQIFRGKSQDKISLCYFKMKICHRITCGVSKYLGGRKISTYLYLSQLVCSPYLYNKLVYVSDHSPGFFLTVSELTVRGLLLCTVRCTLCTPRSVHTTDHFHVSIVTQRS